MKALHPKLDNIWLRNGMIASAVNSRIFYCLPAIWDRAILSAAVSLMNSSTTGIENNWMTGIASQTTSGQEFIVSNLHQRMTLRNLSNHPCKIKIYRCVAREDIRNREAEDVTTPIVTTAQIMAANMLYRGWDERLAAAEATDTNTGTLVQYTNNNPYIETTGELTPYQSSAFTKAWKIEGTTSRIMDPGDYIALKQSCKQVTNQYRDEQQITNTGATVVTQEKLSIWKGRTKFFMVEVVGLLGKQTTDDTVTGYMTTDIGWEMKQTWKHCPKFAAIPSIAHRLDDRTTVAAALEGPSARTMQNQDG